MPSAARKNLRCQNCDYPLEPDFNYCPRCSQHNSDRLTSFGTLAVEVISDFFSYDSRFVKTIYPFLFRPGFLTTEFVAGRRVRYMHPLRLYLFVSLVYFSVVSLVVNVNKPEGEQPKDHNLTLSPVQRDSVRSTIRRSLSGKLSEADMQEVDSALRFSANLDEPAVININLDQDSAKSRTENEFARYLRLIQTKNLTEYQVLDSLRWETTDWNRFKVHQGMRLVNLDKKEFVEFFLGKISLMIFVMLPFVALFLKLLYIRRKRYYMEHLIFVLHIHAFMFLVLAIALLYDYYQHTSQGAFWATCLILIYITLAFRRVYRQGWFKTLTKLFVLFLSYVVSLSFFLLLTLAISALLI